MNNIEAGILSGFLGGTARGLSSFLKKRRAGVSGKFNYPYFFSTVFLSGVLGGIAGALAEGNWKTSFLAGYAGIDFIENLYKSSPFARLAQAK